MGKTGSILLVGLLAAGSAAAQEAAPEAKPAADRSAEAVEILKKADAASKAVNAVRYKATSTPSGAAQNFAAVAEGTVVLVGWNGRGPQKFRIDGKVKRPGAEAPSELSGGGNGDTYFLIDHSAKKAYQDMDPNVMGSSGQSRGGLMMLEFVHDKPFDDEINAQKVELLPEETVAGEECYTIRVGYSPQQTSTWYFSKKDYLPRRRVLALVTPQGEGTLDRTLTALEVDPELGDALFAAKLPEGYQQIDDFAP